ncbi:MAG TPA: cytochrome c [Candidatus Limnocylindrales bacterium]|nr:cytochrome c [Candidatus Limnocylindrales bacterium]
MKRMSFILLGISFFIWGFLSLLLADEEHPHSTPPQQGSPLQPQQPTSSHQEHQGEVGHLQEIPTEPQPMTSSRELHEGHPHKTEEQAHSSTRGLTNLQVRGKELVDQLHCAGCHLVEARHGHTGHIHNFPELYFEGDKVQASWLFSFLKQPYPLRPGIQQRMPDFRLSDEEALAITEYLMTLKDPKASPLPKELKFNGYPTEESIEAGARLAGPEYLACFKCHPQGDKKPEGRPEEWAPDLSLARQRLNPDWVVRWLLDPQKIQPGTKMPTYFPEEKSGPENILEGNRWKQIAALRDYIFSLGPEATDGYSLAKARFPKATAEKGRMLIGNLNCTGCHRIGGFPPDIVPNGPPLLGIREFVPDESWLTHYLLNPTAIQTYPTGYKPHPGARHPGFRLSNEEATAITAYLMTLDSQETSKQEPGTHSSHKESGGQHGHGDHEH